MCGSKSPKMNSLYLRMLAKSQNCTRQFAWIWPYLLISLNDATTLPHDVYCRRRQRPMDYTIYSLYRLGCLHWQRTQDIIVASPLFVPEMVQFGQASNVFRQWVCACVWLLLMMVVPVTTVFWCVCSPKIISKNIHISIIISCEFIS